MNLFEEIVTKFLLNEIDSSRDADIISAIEGAKRVRIGYDDEQGGKGKNLRYIWPVAYGRHKTTGNLVVRAFQKNGSTKRGVPSWKLFRTDRIYSWDNGKRSYINDPYYTAVFKSGMYGEFNPDGDGSMAMGEIYALSPLADKSVELAPDTNPVGKGPVIKQEVEPAAATNAAQKAEPKEPTTPEPEKLSPKTIDKTGEDNYFKNKVEAPASEPVKKQDVVSPQEPSGEEVLQFFFKVCQLPFVQFHFPVQPIQL